MKRNQIDSGRRLVVATERVLTVLPLRLACFVFFITLIMSRLDSPASSEGSSLHDLPLQKLTISASISDDVHWQRPPSLLTEYPLPLMPEQHLAIKGRCEEISNSMLSSASAQYEVERLRAVLANSLGRIINLPIVPDEG
jgi:hypothetical protein